MVDKIKDHAVFTLVLLVNGPFIFFSKNILSSANLLETEVLPTLLHTLTVA